MKKALTFVFLAMAIMAIPAAAQAPAASSGPSDLAWQFIAAGFAMAIASAVCGLAQGKAVASATESLARNPAARPGIQFALILGLVLIESLALYTLAIIFLKVK